jgi:hypothetical protein
VTSIRGPRKVEGLDRNDNERLRAELRSNAARMRRGQTATTHDPEGKNDLGDGTLSTSAASTFFFVDWEWLSVFWNREGEDKVHEEVHCVYEKGVTEGYGVTKMFLE